MSCQLGLLSRFQDIAAVRKYFFPVSRDPTPDNPQDDDNWDEDWGWNAAGESIEDGEDVKAVDQVDNEKHKWFQGCIVSLSPTNDMLAIAYEDKIVVLSQKWDPKHRTEDLESKFSIQWQNNLNQDEGETITAVMCLPLASQKRSTQGGPDWTCIMVGFSTGYVRMFTENGVLLLSQLLHTEPVQNLKCRTYEPPRFLGMPEQHEELVILFRKAVVSIDGFSLFQSLRACRNQVARATASGSESLLQPPPLAYKKWALNEQDKIHDLISSGVHSSNPFDQMKNASLLGGFSASVKSVPPVANVYITSGMGPYVGFFYAMEGIGQPILSDVAIAVANKIKTALISAASGWLGFGGKQKEDASPRIPKIEPSTPLPLRYGLPDQRRTGERLCLSPNNKFAALTDGFGRVTLIDVERGIAIRMWKGYRDAQIGWIGVREDESPGGRNKDHSRVAQFLIIYAPRRGILEVWTAANGPRVAAFNVSKWCMLVCPGYGMMGLNNVTSRGIKSCLFQCALIDPEGSVKTLEIPFHLALSDKNSKTARDLHLLKKLKAILKENSEDSEAINKDMKDLIIDMKIANITKQAVERVLSTKYLTPDTMKNILNVCMKRIRAKGEASLDIDSKLFLRFCCMQENLLHTYKLVEKLKTCSTTASDSTSSDVELVAQMLCITLLESENIRSQLEQFKVMLSDKEPRVTFKDNILGVSSFLHCFTCQPHASERDSSRQTKIFVHKGLSDERKMALAEFFFDSCLTCNASSDDVSIILQDSCLPPDHIIDLLLLYWTSRDDRDVQSLPSLCQLIKTVTEMTDKSDVLVDHNVVSPWWQRVRDICSQSGNIRASYILALASRTVAIEMFGSQTKAKDPDADTASSDKMDMTEWESLTVDVEHWNLLIKQLEDVLALSCLLQIKQTTHEESRPVLEPIRLSINKLTDGGQGSISEVVAQYVFRLQLQPEDLFKHTTASANKFDDSQLSKIQDQLSTLSSRFPHSLENDILLSNCGWEYAVQWNRDPEMVNYFKLSLEYIKAVQNAVLKQGLCSMLWNMYILKHISAGAYLMEKVGKAPKERLCRKETGMGDLNLTVFLQCTVDLLQITMDANCEVNEVPVFNLEQLWQQMRGPASLVELAVDQKATNYHLVRHHYHVVVIMHMIMLFNMKSVKVLSLFDTKGRNCFFKDLHSYPLLPNQNVESSLSLSRREFLCKIIEAAIKHQQIVDPRTQSNMVTVKQCPALALEIGKDFGLDMDYLKRCHVEQLYIWGQDKLAEEVLLTVNDHEMMGSELLLIAGKRVLFNLNARNAADVVTLMSDVSTTLSTWLKQLTVTDLSKGDVPMSDTALLLQHTANKLDEGYSEYNMAIALIELVRTLLETN